MLIRTVLEEMQKLDDLRRRHFHVQVRSAVPFDRRNSPSA